jgi:CRP-like cAMP-binding protein
MVKPEASLRSIEIFAGLTPAELDALAKRCAWREFGPKQEIVGHQDESRHVFFLVRGKARAVIRSLAGREVTFRDIPAGEMFGEFAAIDGEPRSASVEAVQPCLAASMSPELFCEVLLTHPKAAEAMLRRLTRQIRTLSERVFEFSTLAVRNRIHAELVRLASECTQPDGSARLSPPPTHADIASRISTHREAVTRELNDMAQAGLVERKPGALVIRDVARLREMVDRVIEG